MVNLLHCGDIMFAFAYWIFVSQFLSINTINLLDNYDDVTELKFKRNPAPDEHRCGVCPTYFQKICAFDHLTNSTFIFDNHCIMDLYNCIEGNEFVEMKYEHCVYFGNFAYVHGFKYEDEDYDEDHIIIKGSKKNPDFMRRLARLEENVFDFTI